MAVWQRDMSAPPAEPYKGTQFRSHLELAVAKELDALEAWWDYEACPWCSRTVRPIETPARACGVCAGGPVRYLPDFRILIADDRLKLPEWVEVKPAELLYAVRDALGLPEDLGGEDQIVSTTSDRWSQSDVAEIHKPLALAEHTGKAVLVVSAMNRHRTLSILCTRGGMTLSKLHPAVNWKGHLRRVEHEANRQRWAAEAAERKAQYEVEERERLARRADAVAFMQNLARVDPGVQARYAGHCYTCAKQTEADALTLFRVQERWIGMCTSCVTSSRATPFR